MLMAPLQKLLQHEENGETQQQVQENRQVRAFLGDGFG